MQIKKNLMKITVCSAALLMAVSGTGLANAATHADEVKTEGKASSKEVSLNELQDKADKAASENLQDYKDDNFTKEDVQKLYELASSASYKAKAENADDEDMDNFNSVVEEVKQALAGQSKDGQSIDYNALGKKLKKAMTLVDMSNKRELNNLIKRANALVQLNKIPAAALPGVKSAIMNAKNVSSNLSATLDSISDAKRSLVNTLKLAGFKVVSLDDQPDGIGDFKIIPAQNADDEDSDQDDQETQAEAEQEDAGLTNSNIAASDSLLGNDDAQDFGDMSAAIGMADSDASDDLYGYDVDTDVNSDKEAKDVLSDDSDITVKDESDSKLAEALKAAQSKDMELKLALASEDTKVAFEKALANAQTTDDQDGAYDSLMSAINSVNTESKALLAKQLGQINQMTDSKDFSSLSSDNQAVVDQVKQLVATVSADPNATFGDIVQAESAALNVIGQAQRNMPLDKTDIKSAIDAAKAASDLTTKTNSDEVAAAVSGAQDAVKAGSKQDLDKANTALVEAQKNAIANQTSLTSNEAKAAQDTSLKSTSMVAQNGGVKANNIGAVNASMNTQSNHAAPIVSAAPKGIDK